MKMCNLTSINRNKSRNSAATIHRCKSKEAFVLVVTVVVATITARETRAGVEQ